MRSVTEGLVHVAGNAVLDVLVRDAQQLASVGHSWSDNVQRLVHPIEAVLGGCGAATAYVLGALGQQVDLNSNVGRDSWGDMLRGWLESVEVEVAGLETTASAVHVIALDATGGRRSHYYPGEKVDWRTSLEMAVPQLFFAAGYGAVDREDGSELHAVFSELRRRGACIAFDVSPWFAGHLAVGDMLTLWREVDYLIGTEEELLAWQPADDVEDLAERILDRGVECVVIKRGPLGALYAARDGLQGYAAVEEVIAGNSVGAGDSFNGRLLYGLCREESVDRAVAAATNLATHVVRQGRGALAAAMTERRD